MFDFLQLPELNDKYFKSLLFAFSTVILFFGCDYWLNTKHPGTFQKNIKLPDYFITRLRFMIPLYFAMYIAYMGRYRNIQNAFVYSAFHTAAALYLSAFVFKNMKAKEFDLDSYLALFLALCLYETLMDEYFISATIGLIIYCIFMILILRKIKTNRTEADSEQKKPA
jgi:hypothetical protein